MAKKNFKSIQKILSDSKYSIEKAQKTKHYKVHKNGVEYHLYVNLTMNDFCEKIEEFGIDNIIQKYEYTEKINGKKTKKLSTKSKKVKELEKENMEVALGLMDMSLEKGSKCHQDLKRRLHEIHHELIELGVKKSSGQNGKIGGDIDINEIAEIGRKKKAERKRKREKKKQRINIKTRAHA